MAVIVLALGFVLVFEGLVFALLPGRLEELLETLSQVPVERRRHFGLAALAAGVALLWVARHFGAG